MICAGNMWGRCENGTEGIGCGRPETFRNCADISIVTSTLGLPPQFISTLTSAFLLQFRVAAAPNVVYPLVVR